MQPTRIAACIVLIGMLLACRNAQPQSGAQVMEKLPDVSFLLPAPVPLNAPESQFAREQSLRIFSAPVLDPGAIETMAARHETTSREILAQRQADLIAAVCAFEPAERGAAIDAFEIRRQRQWTRWLTLQERYETSLKYRLSAGVHRDDAAGQARLATLLQSRAPVQALQRERQKLISESYARLLTALKNQVEDEPAAACSTDLRPAPPRDVGPGKPAEPNDWQPEEYLYLPYYLALYRFLNLLPPDQRAELLLALHSGKPSDN